MDKYLTEINYDKLVEKSLKNVVIEALKIAQSQGLPGEHHYYITFKTNHPKTKISDQLKKNYPEEMTIIMQHQYSGLTLEKDHFSVILSFSGIPQNLTIPYDAITYFADPYAKFALSFTTGSENSDAELDDVSFVDLEPEVPKKVAGGKATVVSIDSFRKK